MFWCSGNVKHRWSNVRVTNTLTVASFLKWAGLFVLSGENVLNTMRCNLSGKIFTFSLPVVQVLTSQEVDLFLHQGNIKTKHECCKTKELWWSVSQFYTSIKPTDGWNEQQWPCIQYGNLVATLGHAFTWMVSDPQTRCFTLMPTAHHGVVNRQTRPLKHLVIMSDCWRCSLFSSSQNIKLHVSPGFSHECSSSRSKGPHHRSAPSGNWEVTGS